MELELSAEEKLQVRDAEVLELRAFHTMHEFKASADKQLQDFLEQGRARAAATGALVNELAQKRGLDPTRFAFDFGTLKFVDQKPAEEKKSEA